MEENEFIVTEVKLKEEHKYANKRLIKGAIISGASALVNLGAYFSIEKFGRESPIGIATQVMTLAGLLALSAGIRTMIESGRQKTKINEKRKENESRKTFLDKTE